MKQKTKPPKSFYEKRDLPQPRTEWWPEDSGELKSALSEADTPRVLVGDGQHLRPTAIGERTFDVVRTEKCKRILSVDRESKIVRVEAGIRWGDLQSELAERGLSLERYRLYPASATLGGLLSRYQPIHRELWDGDVRTGLVALSAVSPGHDYRYIPAPRKASGPDLRWLYVGGEGLVGAILDASLVAWSPSAARLFTFAIDEIAQASQIVAALWDAGIKPSWVYYSTYKASKNELLVAVHAPPRLLDATARFIAQLAGDVKFETGGEEAVTAARQKLEASHPDRRGLGTARRTVGAAFSVRDVVDVAAKLPDFVENVTITNWTRHHAQAFVRYADGKTLSEFPAKMGRLALDVRPVIDDEPIRWTHAAQTLKQTLDANRVLAVGP